ncbi:RNA polymerase sigma factor [Saccharibacillus kuerlensis]|uniref:RNA polymerase sigma-70 factor, ECF subfamily n=1 Tax=Saccharibacillus kuerlensis TaxID=459527 RepID=A0ABQ2LAT4_9BACL|nr:RNA polymerase sigma factor [Saccharibacillus kuerlensis]GGO06923.1 hypothetical protein GCM10010969_34980 [Saccharibacillus kuerlensis]
MKMKLGEREFGIEEQSTDGNAYLIESRSKFMKLIGEHNEALSKYCRFLTGFREDGEDLLQETWLKAWSAFCKDGHTWNRTYLRNIAYHAWIDRIRKGRERTRLNIGFDSEGDNGIEKAAADSCDPLKLWSAAERLVNVLTPEQRTIYLLMEYLRFTAAETSELLGTTEGGVKASLHRARRKLDRYRKAENEGPSSMEKNRIEDEQTIFAYMEAIRLQDVRALLILRNGGSGEEAALAIRCTSTAQPDRSVQSLLKPDLYRSSRTCFSQIRLRQAA